MVIIINRLERVLWCLFTLVLVFENLAFGQVELKVNTNDYEYTEAKPDNRLRIICPTCHRALYICEVEEFFSTENLAEEETGKDAATCRPMIKGLPESLKTGATVVCPYDGDTPIRLTRVDANGNPASIMIYTNRGWQPTRKRPR